MHASNKPYRHADCFKIDYATGRKKYLVTFSSPLYELLVNKTLDLV